MTVTDALGLGATGGVVGPGLGETRSVYKEPWYPVLVGVTCLEVEVPDIAVAGASTVGDCRRNGMWMCVGEIGWVNVAKLDGKNLAPTATSHNFSLR